ncbi:hypothetical protein D9611_009277 [Ephemerocybe angulata]|uniref:GPI-anchor transamidase n=1 Tax=Ephemerocybe angulata TaxID=980116 RepID=A0A8H5BJ07_9AGAR|nr:hypothetical protein D9611_009277 [Tulosesus angulatus]
MLPLTLFHLFLGLSVSLLGAFASDHQEETVKGFFGRNGTSQSTHTNNWAVLVCTSRYWFNYRHMSNALSMYRTVKRLGIPDSNIILMLADDASCNARNKFPGSVYANPGRHLDLYGENVEVDYRGYEVTVENLIRVLTGRVEPSVPRSKRLLTDEHSNIFVYMAGHGGNEFLKFQDNEEISAFDIADAFEQMYQKKRYNEIFFMVDTCQANSLYSKLYSPNILATGSSQVGENSYSHSSDKDLGVAVIDAYTHYVLELMEGINKTSQSTMQDLFSSIDPNKINSHPGVRSDLFRRPLDKTLITDFFGGVSQIEVVDDEEGVEEEAGLVGGNGKDSVSSTAPAQASFAIPERRASHSKRHIEPVSNTSTTSEAKELWGWVGSSTRAWGAVALFGGLVGWVRMRS